MTLVMPDDLHLIDREGGLMGRGVRDRDPVMALVVDHRGLTGGVEVGRLFRLRLGPLRPKQRERDQREEQ
ncbi:hypothetical protein D3C73_1660780 [compost metagenome]